MGRREGVNQSNLKTSRFSSSWPGKSAKRVFALDVPAIHVFLLVKQRRGCPGSSPGMTTSISHCDNPHPQTRTIILAIPDGYELWCTNTGAEPKVQGEAGGSRLPPTCDFAHKTCHLEKQMPENGARDGSLDGAGHSVGRAGL